MYLGKYQLFEQMTTQVTGLVWSVLQRTGKGTTNAWPTSSFRFPILLCLKVRAYPLKRCGVAYGCIGHSPWSWLYQKINHFLYRSIDW